MNSEPSTRILLTGGQGKTSSRISQLLINQGYLIRSAGRSAPKMDNALADHVNFDWYDDSTHEAALQGISAIYLVAPPDMHPEEFMIPFIRKALDASIRRFVLLSSASVSEHGPVFGPIHQYLQKHAPEWAVLRPSYFMQNFTEGGHGHTIRQQGQVFNATSDGKVGFVDAEDISAVGFHALTDKVPHNREHIITGPQSLNYAEAAVLIHKVTGLTVKHLSITEDQLVHALIAAGVPAPYAALLAGLDNRIRLEGSEDQVTDTVWRVTGRAPRSLEDFIQANKTWFQSAQQPVPGLSKS
ncbi:ergot alkaloid biosynthesis protein [Paenibacillus psychroresistens]|uniref:Ergot alkaloid biosynthesis protein n=1 Tax=Paenibacillus psychroresistens TaxID=1778678 RepID=A0A6B8RVL4_9BACL|nr:NAD(P)H-binding protein [Paenibacillus psychroresistens]QGQ99799.1 ergot alkaloid biosynthesis protein [Paenibacillus psychroresistens]